MSDFGWLASVSLEHCTHLEESDLQRLIPLVQQAREARKRAAAATVRPADTTVSEAEPDACPSPEKKRKISPPSLTTDTTVEPTWLTVVYGVTICYNDLKTDAVETQMRAAESALVVMMEKKWTSFGGHPYRVVGGVFALEIGGENGQPHLQGAIFAEFSQLPTSQSTRPDWEQWNYHFKSHGCKQPSFRQKAILAADVSITRAVKYLFWKAVPKPPGVLGPTTYERQPDVEPRCHGKYFEVYAPVLEGYEPGLSARVKPM